MTAKSAVRMGAYACLALFWVLRIPQLASGQAESRDFGPLVTSESDVSITTTSKTREGLVHLDVRIADQTGKAIGGLIPSDLRLLDNGVPAKILSLRTSVAADENERLNEVALVLDDLDMPDKLVGEARENVIKYLRQNRDLAQPISVYQLTSTGFYILAGPGRDGYELAAGVMAAPARKLWHGSPIADWNTALRSVNSLAVRWREGPGRKALVWIGPGWPVDGSVAKSALGAYFGFLVELTSRIRDARMVVYQVSRRQDSRGIEFGYVDYAKGVQSASQMGNCLPHFSLQVLAAQSGGLLRNGGDDVVRDLERVVQDAGTFYTLSFDPPPAERVDEYHDLKVQVGTPGAAARTTTGYYNQPVFYDQPRIPAQRATVEQLDEVLQRASEESDWELALQLKGMELSERMSSSKLASWLHRLHGRQSKAALTLLADTSVYLAPPDSEILPTPPPDFESQAQMLKRTVQYLVKLVSMLPDFYAMRTLAQYDQRMPEEITWKTASADQSLHESITEKATLFYRNGHEEQIIHKRKGKAGSTKDLSFSGIFGPILNHVLHDAGSSANGLAWSRWEHGAEGNEAVFQYSVHMDDPSYEVASCCLRNGNVFRTRPEYHGELTIDPETGAVLRLTMESAPGWIVEPDLTPIQPVKATGMMLEFGPVQLGGKTFICPLRSVVTLRSRVVRQLSFWGTQSTVYGPYETTMDDIAFSDYHKFGSESHILSGFEVVQGGQAQPTTHRTH
jgi:VWFA-related protein